MSKIARLASIVERAEKQALVLFIDESKQNDSTALAMLSKRGVPEPEKVLELLKEITVDGTENGKTVWDISKTGKEIQPLAGWFCSTWNNDDLVQARERVADTVHKMYQIPSARNADLTKVWLANKELTDYEEWVKRAYEQDKAKGLIADAEEGEKVNVGAYEFPKKMLAYSDKYVDCYRADTPADAMLLGDGYPFCISRRDGSNMFYTYRMNPTTTAYFCWFKDENGNKSHDDMVVVHVGEDGRYMVTKSENGNFPRDSKETTIKKYPKLKGAINSGKLIVVPLGDDEKEVRQKYNYRSDITVDDLEGKSPKYIELVLAQGVNLTDDAFDYIFNTIDKRNLRTGNNGNSLIKKYIESGVHKLSKHQKEVLEKSGYEHEVYRNLKVWWRGRLAINSAENMQPDEITYFIEHGDLDTDDSVLLEYITKNGATSNMLVVLRSVSEKHKQQIRVVLARYYVNKENSGIKVVLEEGKIVVRGSAKKITLRYTESVVYIDKLEGIEEVDFLSIDFDKLLNYRKKLVELQDGVNVKFSHCDKVDLSLFGGVEFGHLMIHSGNVKGNTVGLISAKSYELTDYVYLSDNVIGFPKGVDKVLLGHIDFKEGVKVEWPRKLTNLDVSYASMLYRFTGFEGITEEITGIFCFGTTGLPLNQLKGFPKKINRLVLRNIDWEGKVPKLIQDSKINVISMVSEKSLLDLDGLVIENFGEKDSKVVDWIAKHQGVVKLDSDSVRGVKVEDKGRYYDLEVNGDCFMLNSTPDKPIYTLEYKVDSNSISFSRMWGRNKAKECRFCLGCIIDLDAIPYEFNTNADWMILNISDILRDKLKLTHEVKGVNCISIESSEFLKKIEGLEKFKGLAKVVIMDCPNLDTKSIKVVEGVELDVDYANMESLSLSPLRVALNSIMD